MIGPRDPALRLVHSFRGAASIGELFVCLLRHAAAGLTSADVATLLRRPVGDVNGLDWTPPSMRAEVVDHFDRLAQRDTRERLRVRKPERERLASLVGGEGALGDPRRAFVVAHAIDEVYAQIAPRLGARSATVAEVPPVFLGEAANGPPTLGQMTPMAACQRWMRAFWYVGDARRLDVFGPLPEPTPRALSARARQTLAHAVDVGELRVAIASWKHHTPADLQPLAAAEGCFAYSGYVLEPDDDEVDAVLAAARRSKPHVLVFPELAFSQQGVARLVARLRANVARFPALIALGRGHRSRDSGGFDNTGVILDAHGDVLLEHEKMEPFAADVLLEDIVPRQSRAYEYLDTPVGRIVLNVCRDVRSDVPMVMNRALGVSLLLVPAYSKRLDFVLEEARVLGARQRAIVVSANASGAHLTHAAALYAPIRGDASSIALPTDENGGTVHAFSVRLGAGAVASLDAPAPFRV
ncbi:MAG: hypothetical protein IPF92_30775 [Myxococcales bacterium]|nr:hypothetical protein [Myxococcales bacterium]